MNTENQAGSVLDNSGVEEELLIVERVDIDMPIDFAKNAVNVC